MPIIKSAIKRMRQTVKRRARNIELKQNIKNATKSFRAKPSSQGLSEAQSAIDTAIKKGLLKKNTAARRKAQLHKEAKNAGVKLASSKKDSKKPAAKSTTKKVPSKTTAKKAPAKKPAAKKPATKKTAKK
jgi:ribosomal protein S20